MGAWSDGTTGRIAVGTIAAPTVVPLAGAILVRGTGWTCLVHAEEEGLP